MKFLLPILTVVSFLLHPLAATSKTVDDCVEMFMGSAEQGACRFMPAANLRLIPARKPEAPAFPSPAEFADGVTSIPMLTQRAFIEILWKNAFRRLKEHYVSDDFVGDLALEAVAQNPIFAAFATTANAAAAGIIVGIATEDEPTLESRINLILSALFDAMVASVVDIERGKLPAAPDKFMKFGAKGQIQIALAAQVGTLAGITYYAFTDTLKYDRTLEIPRSLVLHEIFQLKNACRDGKVELGPDFMTTPEPEKVTFNRGDADCDWTSGHNPFCHADGCDVVTYPIHGNKDQYGENIPGWSSRVRLPRATPPEPEGAAGLSRVEQLQKKIEDHLVEECKRISAGREWAQIPAQCLDKLPGLVRGQPWTPTTAKNAPPFVGFKHKD